VIKPEVGAGALAMNHLPVVAGTLLVDRHAIEFHAFDTIASCLMRAGILALRSSLQGEPRGVFCGIGVCNDCLVTVDGQPNRRACQVEATPGLVVLTNRA
jgi:hypothetical protein